jgi:transcriptional regulator with XRE-family HTH domain
MAADDSTHDTRRVTGHDAPVDRLDEQSSVYMRKVGDRMRAIRRQRGLSLHDVERVSGDEFKASVLGAYERGERAISVPRLERLATVYQVPAEQFLPRDDPGRIVETPASPALVIDMSRLSDLSGEPFGALARFVRSIQIQRTEVALRMVQLRADDTRAVAAIVDAPIDQVVDRLRALDIMPRA